MMPKSEWIICCIEWFVIFVFFLVFLASKEFMFFVAAALIAIQTMRIHELMSLVRRLNRAIEELGKLNQAWIKRAQPKGPITTEGE